MQKEGRKLLQFETAAGLGPDSFEKGGCVRFLKIDVKTNKRRMFRNDQEDYAHGSQAHHPHSGGAAEVVGESSGQESAYGYGRAIHQIKAHYPAADMRRRA